MAIVSNPKPGDDVSTRQAIAKLGSIKLGSTSVPTYANVTLTDLTANSLIYPNSSKLLTSLGAATNGQLPIGSTGATPVLAGLTGTANQVTITNGAGSITISAPQDIHTGATDFEVAGLKVTNKITEFSTDGTMGGDSDSAVPTEKATKLYTDTLRSDLASVANAKGASLVGVEDSASQFDATDVEAALSELMVLVTPVEYNPTMTRTTGGDAGGDDDSVATIDDADSYDTDEVSGTPGFDIQAVFSGVTDFNQVQIHTAYDGNPAHVVRIDLDKTPFDWSSYDTVLADIDDNSGDFIFKAITVTNVGQYINSGEVRLRFYHSSAGNATHNFFIDYCALWKTGVSTGVTEHGGLTGLDDVADHPSYLLLDGSRALTGAWDMGNQNLTNVDIDTGDIDPAVTQTHDGNTLQLDAVNSDGGAFSFTTSGAITFSQNLIMADGKTIGQAAGPLLAFDDSNNYLEITGCDVGVGLTAPTAKCHVSADGVAVPSSLTSNDIFLVSNEGTIGATVCVASSAAATRRGVFKGVRARGTFGSPVVPNTDDYVLSFLGTIFDGVDGEATAAIDFFVDGAVSENVAPQRISFNTSATNGAGRTERFLIKSDGAILIPETAAGGGNVAAYGQLWVKNDAPCTLWFQDDTGADFQLGVTSAHTHDGDTLQLDAVNSNGGAFSFTTSGLVTFSQNTQTTGLGIGTATIPHGAVGAAKLAIEGTNSSTAGPHIQFTTASDDYPLLQILPYTHDNISLIFDAYFDGAWKSSDAGSSFRIAKNADELKFTYDTAAAGAAVTWNEAAALDASGQFTFEKSIFMAEIAAAAADVAGDGQWWVKNSAPNEAWFTDDAGTDWQLGAGGRRVSAYVSGNQSVNSATYTTVQFDTENYDKLGEYNNGTYRFQPSVTGYYHICAFVTMSLTDAADKNMQLVLDKNSGTLLAFCMASRGSDASACTGFFAKTVYLLSTDFVEVQAYHYDAAARNILGTIYYSYLTIDRVSG